MTVDLQLARGADSLVSSYTGPAGEIVVSTTDWRPYVQDGATAGGHKVAMAADLPTSYNQAANTVYAGPASGAAAVPSFRALAAADIPPSSVATGLTAAGSTQATALALTAAINEVTTVASGTGVALPLAAAGIEVSVVNAGANALAIYPASGGQIDALGTNAARSLAAGGRATFRAVSGTGWYGFVSA